MSEPSLQRLRVFVTVVDTGGVTAAARALDTAQSTASAHLRQLEDEMGVRLLDRGNGGLRPTPAGEILLGHARRVLDTYADAVADLRRLGHGPTRGTLSLGGTATAGEGVLPRLLVEYTRLHPLVDVDLHLDNTSEAIRLLETGEVGLVVAADAGVDGTHESVRIAQEPQVVIAAASHPLAGTAFDPAVLWGTTILVREHGSTTRAFQLALLESWRIPRARVWTIRSTAAIVHAVAAGLGIACVTRGAAESDLKLGRLTELALEPAPPTRPIHLILRQGRTLGPAEQEFVTLARERTSS